jgi:thiamine pyrophosphate-dependent acetolactate synthase large subunit-like protein
MEERDMALSDGTARIAAGTKVDDVVAEVLRREGVEVLFCYPLNSIIEAAARAGIRPIVVRQERVGLHMADALSRVTSGERIGVFAMQNGPGTENAFGGVAQAYGESVPIVVLPAGYDTSVAFTPRNFNAYLNFQHVTKAAEHVGQAANAPAALRRAHPGSQRPTGPRPRRAAPGRAGTAAPGGCRLRAGPGGQVRP